MVLRENLNIAASIASVCKSVCQEIGSPEWDRVLALASARPESGIKGRAAGV